MMKADFAEVCRCSECFGKLLMVKCLDAAGYLLRWATQRYPAGIYLNIMVLPFWAGWRGEAALSAQRACAF